MTKAVIISLAHTFVARSQCLGYKGKKRDGAAIDFFAGAIAGLRALPNNPEAEIEAKHLELFTTLLLCTRGYSEIERVLSEA